MIPKGANVIWTEGNQSLEGMVHEAYPEEVQLTVEGHTMIKRGTPKDRVLYIINEQGQKTLMLESEVKLVK